MLDAARRREYAQLINDSGQHLLGVVNGILDMSKMESGSFEITPEPFAPRAALINCCNLLALKARENGIDLATRVLDDLPVMTGDPRAFKQIVLNLVSNAIKFTERGGRVTVSAVVEGPNRHRTQAPVYWLPQQGHARDGLRGQNRGQHANRTRRGRNYI
jgi:two-component system, cell cycle sensor histidine kinase DivJ